jgi:hypothetical protein
MEDEINADLEKLTEEGRFSVKPLTHHPEALHVKTPEGTIFTTRRPDSANQAGSDRQQSWTFGEYRLSLSTDTQPEADTHTATVSKKDGLR